MTNIIEVALWTGPCAVVQIDQLIQKPLSVEKYNQKKKLKTPILCRNRFDLRPIFYVPRWKMDTTYILKIAHVSPIFHPEHGI